MRLSLNALPAFRAVAELQNLSAAAERLHLTHSAVSQQIRGLEEQLFRPVRAQRPGHRAEPRWRGAAVQRAGSAGAAGRRHAHGRRRGCGQFPQLRVSVLPSRARSARMARWRARHPELTLEMETSQQVVDLLRDGFHAALRFGRGPWAGVESEPLFDVPLPLIALASPKRRAPCRTIRPRRSPDSPAGRARCLATLVQLGRAAHSGEPRRDLQ